MEGRKFAALGVFRGRVHGVKALVVREHDIPLSLVLRDRSHMERTFEKKPRLLMQRLGKRAAW